MNDYFHCYNRPNCKQNTQKNTYFNNGKSHASVPTELVRNFSLFQLAQWRGSAERISLVLRSLDVMKNVLEDWGFRYKKLKKSDEEPIFSINLFLYMELLTVYKNNR